MQALSHIRQIDYTVIFARDMEATRHFYETVMEFPLVRTLSDRWIEYRV
jgi:lactoylglutathione lyase